MALRSKRTAAVHEVRRLFDRYTVTVARKTEPGLLRRVFLDEQYPHEVLEAYVGHHRNWARIPGYSRPDPETEELIVAAVDRALARGEVL
jgi:hypothetical protein